VRRSTPVRRAPLVVALTAIAMTALAAPASAGVSFNTIDRKTTLDADGRIVAATGPIRCSAVERATIRVTVTQRRTGAVAEGTWQGRCGRTTRTWTAKRFALRGAATFQPGAARACALGVTRRAGQATDPSSGVSPLS
jgi:hypothetical protein